MNSANINDIWEYTGYPDAILDRYRIDTDIIPINYPNWSEKKWRCIWHCHNKAMQIIKTEKIEQERQEQIQSQENIVNVLNALIQKKELKNQAIQNQRTNIATLVLKKGNNKNCMETFIKTKNSFELAPNDSMLWLWNYTQYTLKISKGKHRKNMETIIQVLFPIMKKRSLPLSWKELATELAKITPERIKEFQKLIRTK